MDCKDEFQDFNPKNGIIGLNFYDSMLKHIPHFLILIFLWKLVYFEYWMWWYNNKSGNIIFVGNLLKFQSKKYNKENLKWIKSDIYWYFIDWYIFYFILEKNSNDKNNVLHFNNYVNNFNNYSEISLCHLVNINRLI